LSFKPGSNAFVGAFGGVGKDLAGKALFPRAALRAIPLNVGAWRLCWPRLTRFGVIFDPVCLRGKIGHCLARKLIGWRGFKQLACYLGKEFSIRGSAR
jgi:hypothetical protein